MSISELLNNLTPASIFPVAIGVFLIFFFIYYIKTLQPRRGTAEWITVQLNKPALTVLARQHTMSSKDATPLIIITVLFLILALFNLGGNEPINVLNEIHEPSADRNHINNMYFDEIYFVRTAVEHIENIPPFELSHPPLGKEIIALSILLFGASPFGWRLIGALIGVLMIVIMYIFVKNMFGKTVIASCAALLFGFDFMRFVQTRIATIDTFAVFFILLSFFFMYRHITTDINAPFKKSLPSLAFSGIFFGLSFATKWIGFYAGAGLLLIYTIRLIQLGSYYFSTRKNGFGIYITKTILYSALFFVIIPVFIYYLTYIPYGTARGMSIGTGMLWSSDYFRIVWNNQVLIYTYHSNLVAEHPFSSVWWQWILNVRPILYVNNYIDESRATFGAFGNPVVWWGGFIAMIMMVVRIFTHRDGKALFIVTGFLSQLLPWVAVSRILFAYHYFPSTLFLILALAHIFNTIIERRRRSSAKSAIYGYTAVSGTIFAVFYPSMAGMYLPGWFYSNYLRWFTSWPF